DELMHRVLQAAAFLQLQGLAAGDRLMLVLPNCPDFITLWFAAHYLGLEVVPANPLMSASELTQLARRCNVRAVAGLDLRLGPVARMLHEFPVPLLIVASLARHLPWHWRCGYRVQQLRTGQPALPPRVRVMPSTQLYDSAPGIRLGSAWS